MNSPCLNCDRITPEKRYPGCHGKCEPYLAYNEANRERSKSKEAEHEIPNATYDIRQRRFDKNGRMKK